VNLRFSHLHHLLVLSASFISQDSGRNKILRLCATERCVTFIQVSSTLIRKSSYLLILMHEYKFF